MIITKNDINSFIEKVENQTIRKDKHSKNNLNNDKVTIKFKADSQIFVDSLRGKALNIQSEEKNLQTEISFLQTQLQYLKKVSDKENWKNELVRFMQDKFSKQDLSEAKINSSKGIDQFQDFLNQEIDERKNNLIRKETQMQNIFSLVSIEDNSVDKLMNFIKNTEQQQNNFASLKPEIVSKLI